VHVRNPNYWRTGEPYFDEVIVIDFPDDTARVNALLSGQVDAIAAVPPAQVNVVNGHSGTKVLESPSAQWTPICMRVDSAPFNDVRVRQAMRLIADRPQMVRQALSGHGRVGNDLYAPFDEDYARSLPQRHQDIAKAKSLLKAAGHGDGLTVTMTTANEDYGLIPGAQVFAQNAKQAGVNVKLSVIQPSVYDPKFLQWPFTQDYWGNKPFGIMYSLLYSPGGIFNSTHFDDKQGNQIFSSALKEVDEAKRNAKLRSLEEILYNRGGHIIHTFRQTVDAYDSKFAGFTADKSTGWSLGQYRFKEVHLA
jgi:peptide/nickel transport system substrate-binding protein